jgi:asparagine synthase (glutamine-hydrolysing)
MCGICGIVKFNGGPPDQQLIRRMMDAIRHRGPNDEGLLTDDKVGLGFLRLSIIDLSSLGHQPMYSADKRYAIVFNGEVYNYLELRDELVKKGYQFHSKTDTEVLLNSYIEWGEECLNRFNGMWAFVIYDRVKQQLFCARDRFGVKPFYYYHTKEQFVFASEIPALLAALDKKPAVNDEALFDYMVYNRTDQSERTFFNEIKKLQHSHTLTLNIKEGAVKPARWYDLKNVLRSSKPFCSPESFRETFNSAVKLRLRSDVPVGVCLSGGLDSSSITSTLLSSFNRNDINTFSAVYEKGQIGDESEFINEFRPYIQKMNFVTPTADSLYADLQGFVGTHAEPFPTTSIYAHYKVMELAQKHVVVTLDGQGADEEMGGYPYFFGFYYKELIKQFRFLKLSRELKGYWSNHHSTYAYKTLLYFLLPGGIKKSLRVREKGYLTKDFSNQEFHSLINSELYSSESLNAALYNHFEYKLEHLLKWQDLNSMRFSIEARVPFLDYRLVEGLLTIKPDKLISGGMTKMILRNAMTGILPEKIRMRKDKVGFETPQNEWFKTKKFQTLINDILHSESFKSRNIVDAQKAKNLYKSYLEGNIDLSKEVWKWINLELWYRKYVDGKELVL